jgi:hypothetical protein
MLSVRASQLMVLGRSRLATADRSAGADWGTLKLVIGTGWLSRSGVSVPGDQESGGEIGFELDVHNGLFGRARSNGWGSDHVRLAKLDGDRC